MIYWQVFKECVWPGFGNISIPGIVPPPSSQQIKCCQDSMQLCYRWLFSQSTSQPSFHGTNTIAAIYLQACCTWTKSDVRRQHFKAHMWPINKCVDCDTSAPLPHYVIQVCRWWLAPGAAVIQRWGGRVKRGSRRERHEKNRLRAKKRKGGGYRKKEEGLAISLETCRTWLQNPLRQSAVLPTASWQKNAKK